MLSRKMIWCFVALKIGIKPAWITFPLNFKFPEILHSRLIARRTILTGIVMPFPGTCNFIANVYHKGYHFGTEFLCSIT